MAAPQQSRTEPGPPRLPRPSPAAAARLLAWILPLVLAATIAHHSLSDLDIWLHHRAGSDILAGEGVLDQNTYSFTAPEHLWVDHEWLFQVLVAALARLRGGVGAAPELLSVPWHLFRVSLAVLLMWLLIRDRAVGRGRPQNHGEVDRNVATLRPLWLAPVAVVTLAVLWPRIILRPELISYCCFVLSLRWIEDALVTTRAEHGPELSGGNRHEDGDTARRPARWRHWLSWLSWRRPQGRVFWLTVFWAQCHGFYSLAILIWLLAALLTPLQRWLDRRQSMPPGRAAEQGATTGRIILLCLGGALLTLVAGALTPNGIAGLVYPLRALGQFSTDGVDLRDTITELVPLSRSFGALGTTILVFRWSLVWALIWIVATLGRVTLLRIVLLLIAAWSAWNSQRAIGFYALTFYLLHSGLRDDQPCWWQPWLARHAAASRRYLGPRVRIVLAGLALTVALAVGVSWWLSLASDRFYLREGVTRRFGAGLTPGLYPVTAAARLASRSAPTPPRIVNNVDAAGFLIDRRVGAVYIDGRTEAYPTALWTEYAHLKAGGPVALKILRERRADAVCLAHRSQASHPLLATLLGSPDWELVTVDEAGVLLASAPGTATVAAAVARLARAGRELLAEVGDPDAQVAIPTRQGPTRSADRCLSLATLLRMGGENQLAGQLLRRAHQLSPRHPIVNHNLGNLLLAQGDAAAALAHFQVAAAENRRAVGSRINLGVCLFHLERPAEAAAALESALDLDPRRAEAWVNLAEARRLLGQRRAAIEAYERAQELLPGDDRLRRRAAEFRRGER